MDDDTRHEEIARLLREQAGAQAPPGLAEDVMREVRAEPRRSAKRPVWRSVGAVAVAAAVLVAAGVGLAQFAGGGGTGAEREAGGSVAAEDSKTPPTDAGAATGSDSRAGDRMFTVSRAAATGILGVPLSSAGQGENRVVIVAGPSRYKQLQRDLEALPQAAGTADGGAPPPITIVLRHKDG
jgi:hypothetical protein